MPEYHVEFTLVSDECWESKTAELAQITTEHGSIVIPWYATIEVSSRLQGLQDREDGYYILIPGGRLFKKEDSQWYSRNRYGAWDFDVPSDTSGNPTLLGPFQ